MQNSLSVSANAHETLVSTKELATVLGVDRRTVQMAAKRILDLTKVHSQSTGGRPTKVFNEKQATAIKQEIQKHHNLASRQIDSASTELEVLQNYKQATEAMIAMLSAKTEALQAENAYLANFKTDIEKKIANAELVETPSENARNHLWQNIQKVGTAIGDYRQAWRVFWDMVKRDTSIDVKTRATNKGVKPMDYICNELNIEIFNKIFADKARGSGSHTGKAGGQEAGHLFGSGAHDILDSRQ
jgi:chromosome segregation ATPase